MEAVDEQYNTGERAATTSPGRYRIHLERLQGTITLQIQGFLAVRKALRRQYMRGSTGVAGLLLVLSVSCFPSGQGVTDALEATLRSVEGDWTGIAGQNENAIALEFRLQQGSNGQLSGTGTMKEDSAPSEVAITVSGTFQRPNLSLTFSGMVYEGQQVQGTAEGRYTTVGGISTTLQLTGPGYSRVLPVILLEN